MSKRPGGAAGEGNVTKKTRGPADDEEEDWDMDAECEAMEVEEDVPVEFTPETEDCALQDVDEKSWNRPELSPLDPRTTSLVFQQTDAQQYMGKPLAGMPGSSTGIVPIIRMFGVTAEGHSVLMHVHGFAPYFYVKAPAGFSQMDCGSFRQALNAQVTVQANMRADETAVPKVEIEMKQSLVNYHFNKLEPFLKITMQAPHLVVKAKLILEGGLGSYGNFYPTFESNVLYVLRFMIDSDIVGCNWLELCPGKYRVRPASQMTCHCQIEVDVAFNAIKSHSPTTVEWSKQAPLRILSFDIECAGRKGYFPDATMDPVIQIASMVTCQGDSKPIVRNVMTLNSCAPIAGSHVQSFDSEKELLLAWRSLVQHTDPDVVIGYNSQNFDLPYLLDRAEALKVPKFPFLGRLKGVRTTMKKTTFQSKAFGKKENKEIMIDGRVQFDVLQCLQREYKLRSYTLNSVSAHFLGEQKEDVHHSIITDLQMGNSETRRRLAVYCLKDAYLPQRLLDKLMLLVNYIEMARVTGVPLSFLLTRGQQIKVVSQILRKCAQHSFVVPNNKKSFGGDEDGYEGATVLEPIRGYYDDPVTTLDFASLYPSIMQAHNLCYSTLVRSQDIKMLDPSQYAKTPHGGYFVKSETRKGILPEILDELLGARKRAKADMKKAEYGSLEYAVLDGRQLALKISANSVYGFTGATVGSLPCVEIASSVTSYGREMIDKTKNIVESKYCKANGYAWDALVVYGDTDSVMIKFGTPDVKESMELGVEAAALVTEAFIKPIKLEFEKVFWPYLLINKKRYAGLYWTNPDKWDKMHMSGIESVRRDNCPLVKTVMDTCLKKILIDRNVVGAIEYTKSVISDLLQNKMDLSMLVITKAVSKSAEDYSNKQAHIELMNRMKKRDAGSAPTMGDRVPYVMIQKGKGAKGYEKAEDPIYVLDNNIPIDAQWYLEHQISQPLMRLFEPIMENPGSLLTGDHTRKIYKPTPTSGGIMNFAKKSLTCLGCRAPIANSDKTCCKHCKSKEPQLYVEHQNKVAEYQEMYSRTWTQCQSCQGSMHLDVLCTSRDCPIFYLRKKVQKDLRDATVKLDRFSMDW